MTVDDSGVVESSGKSLPLLLQSVTVDVFPEGGECVAGLPCRLYIEATGPLGDPVDVAGGENVLCVCACTCVRVRVRVARVARVRVCACVFGLIVQLVRLPVICLSCL